MVADRSRWWCALAAGILAPCGHARAQDVARPEASGRVVRVFDFEERDTNPGEVPELWYRAQDEPEGARRPGFPPWNRARIRYTSDGAIAASGIGAVELPTRGGSTSLMLAPGAIPVFANADYRVAARVRTVGLTHARALVEARFLDAQRRPIPGETYRSGPLLAEHGWLSVEFEAIGRAPEAAWLQLELLLLQPEHLDPARPTGEHHVRAQDFEGSAWFDDVRIIQLPRVEITTQAPGNLFTFPERPRLDLLVRDLTGESLTIVGEVLDADGRVVATTTHESRAGLFRAPWSPDLPGMGWYRARSRVRSGGREVDGASADFAWVPGSPTSTGIPEDLGRFSLDLRALPQSEFGRAHDLVRRAGVGHATLEVWTDDLAPARAGERAKALLDGVSGLLMQGRGVSMSVAVVPRTLAEELRVGRTESLAAFAGARAAWEPFATDILETIGPRVAHWRLGSPAQDTSFWNPALERDLERARASLASFVPSVRLELTGSIERAWPGRAGADAFVLGVPHDLPAEGVRLAVDDWTRRADAADLTLWFDPPEFAGRDGVAVLARQVIEGWLGAGDRTPPSFALSAGFEWVGERRPSLEPGRYLPAWRTLADQLHGRRDAGEFLAGPGVRCAMLAPAPGSGRTGALVAWSESDAGADLEAYLGPGTIRVTDLDGNTVDAEQLPQTSDRRPPGVRIRLTPSPVFIEGVDMGWCRFLSSIRLDPATLDSSGRDQDLAFEVRGTWRAGAAGSITILEPGGLERGERSRLWRIAPRHLPFRVGPGETTRIPFSVGFSPVEESGAREMVLEVEVQGERAYGPVEVRRTFEIGSRGLRLELATSVQGQDVIVDAIVSNAGSEPSSLRLTAFAPGQPRAKAVIPDLPTGNQATRRFRFEGAARALRGERLMVVIEDPESGARLVRSAIVP